MPASSRHLLFISLMSLLAACNALPSASPPTATRAFSAPTVEASPTVRVRTSDELYGDPLDGRSDPTAAALPNEGILPPQPIATREPGAAESVQLLLDNGQVIVGDLYDNPDAGQRVPGVMLVAPDRLGWGILPVELLAAGFSVLVVDMPVSPRATDLTALLTSFSETGTVDPGRLAVIGADSGADFALLGCATLAMCDAVALFNPQSGDTLLNIMPNYRPRPLFFAAGQDNPEQVAFGVVITGAAGDGSQFVQFAAGAGRNLLNLYPELSEQLVAWLRTVLGAV